MRIKFNKELEYIFKKIFISEKTLLKNRLKRAIKNNYEKEIVILDQIVKKDLESVDVGVYRGVYTYKLSQLSKHVHAFEPNPLIFPKLNKNLSKIVQNVTFYNIALSNKEKETDLKIPKRNKTILKKNYEEMFKLGCATIHKDNILKNNNFETYKVKTSKLDDILINKRVGFIKIDVEGHEKNVIEGARRIIKTYKPNLLVEIEEQHSNEKAEKTINYINNLGYNSFFVDNLKLVDTTKLKNLNLINNFIFIAQ